MTENGDNGEELYPMGELEKDLKRGRGARRLPWFAAGLALGIAGALLIPRFAGPYLPSGFGGARDILSGPVLDVRQEDGRLLLTIETGEGALIASFSERVAEIGMLISAGDTVTIAVPDYDPFVENPDFEGVRKAKPGSSSPAGPTGGDAAGTAEPGGGGPAEEPQDGAPPDDPDDGAPAEEPDGVAPDSSGPVQR